MPTWGAKKNENQETNRIPAQFQALCEEKRMFLHDTFEDQRSFSKTNTAYLHLG